MVEKHQQSTFLEYLLSIRQPGSPILTFDMPFRSFMGYWVIGETVDATSACLEVSHWFSRLTGSSNELCTARKKESVLKLLSKAYHRKSGGFWVAPEPVTGSLYATLCALSCLKSLHYTDSRPNAFEPEVVNALLKQLNSTSEKVRDFVLRQLRKGVFLDHEPAYEQESISSLFVACRILENLGFDRDQLRREAGNKVITNMKEFLRACYINLSPTPILDMKDPLDAIPTPIAGFSVNPGVHEPSLCTTYYGLRVASFLGMRSEFEGKERDQILRFIRTCFCNRTGGFSSIRNGTTSLNSTAYGLRCFKELKVSHAAKCLANSLETFVGSCWNNGFSFAPDLTPNAYAGKYAMEISRFLRDACALPSESFEQLLQNIWSSLDAFRIDDRAIFMGISRDRTASQSENFTNALSIQTQLIFLALKARLKSHAKEEKLQRVPSKLWKAFLNAIPNQMLRSLVFFDYPAGSEGPAPGVKLEESHLEDMLLSLSIFTRATEYAKRSDYSKCWIEKATMYKELCLEYLAGHLWKTQLSEHGLDKACYKAKDTTILHSVLLSSYKYGLKTSQLSNLEKRAFKALVRAYVVEAEEHLRSKKWSTVVAKETANFLGDHFLATLSPRTRREGDRDN